MPCCVSGILSLGYRGDNVAGKDLLLKWAAVLVFGLCAALTVVFTAPRPGDAA